MRTFTKPGCIQLHIYEVVVYGLRLDYAGNDGLAEHQSLSLASATIFPSLLLGQSHGKHLNTTRHLRGLWTSTESLRRRLRDCGKPEMFSQASRGWYTQKTPQCSRRAW